ncbi:Os03g0667150, partial [Oryza sativa Japonica Group]
YYRDSFPFLLPGLNFVSYLGDEDADVEEDIAAPAALSLVKAFRTSSLSSEKRILLVCWSSAVPLSSKIKSVDSSFRNLSRTSEQCGKYRLKNDLFLSKHQGVLATSCFALWGSHLGQPP